MITPNHHALAVSKALEAYGRSGLLFLQLKNDPMPSWGGTAEVYTWREAMRWGQKARVWRRYVEKLEILMGGAKG